MQRQSNSSTDESGIVSTPSRSRTTRQHPPWPVSPATPSSPTRPNYSSICPGAPAKNRSLEGMRFFDDTSTKHYQEESDEQFTERMQQRGIVPRRLDFGDDLQHDSRGASANTIRRQDDYPILHIGVSPSTAPPPQCPTSSQLDSDIHTNTTNMAPALEMRTRRPGKHSTKPL